MIELVYKACGRKKDCTCLITVRCSDKNNRTLSWNVEGASRTNLPKEYASDHMPEEQGSLINQLGMAGLHVGSAGDGTWGRSPM